MSQDQHAGKNHNIKISKKTVCKGGTVEIFGSSPNKSKFHSGRP
jgi:hypothetical protein